MGIPCSIGTFSNCAMFFRIINPMLNATWLYLHSVTICTVLFEDWYMYCFTFLFHYYVLQICFIQSLNRLMYANTFQIVSTPHYITQHSAHYLRSCNLPTIIHHSLQPFTIPTNHSTVDHIPNSSNFIFCEYTVRTQVDIHIIHHMYEVPTREYG